MKMRACFISWSLVGTIGSIAVPAGQPTAGAEKTTMATKSVYEFTVSDIDGKEVALSTYEGDVLLIVNVASQ